MDTLLVVKNLEEFHRENYLKNPSHYPVLFGERRVVLVHNLFPLFYFTNLTHKNFLYKYGVISESEFKRDLEYWEYFSIAGRLQKPFKTIFSVDNYEGFFE